MSTPQSGAEILARIQPRLRTERTQLCLRPDLLDQWEDLNHQLAEARERDGSSPRLGTGGSSAKTKQLARQIVLLEEQIEETSIWFELQAMPKDEWTALTEKYPPRPDNQIDMVVGYNRTAVEDAAVRPCIVDPVFDDASWAGLMPKINPGEWAELVDCARRVNGAVTSVPKSALAASVLTRRGAVSKSPKSGE